MICAPAEWWKIRQPTPSVLDDSDDSDDKSDGDSAEFAVQLMTPIPDCSRLVCDILMETSGGKWHNLKWTIISLTAHGS